MSSGKLARWPDSFALSGRAHRYGLCPGSAQLSKHVRPRACASIHSMIAWLPLRDIPTTRISVWLTIDDKAPRVLTDRSAAVAAAPRARLERRAPPYRSIADRGVRTPRARGRPK